MKVLVLSISVALCFGGSITQHHDERNSFNAPKSIEKGFAPLRSYFDKDSTPDASYDNPSYEQSGYQNQVQQQPASPQYIFMPQSQALTGDPPQQYGQHQVPDAISNYLAVVSQKYGQNGQAEQRQGPQVFTPAQMNRPSPFQAPDTYQFVPPDPSQYQQPMPPQYQPISPQYQQSPAQFNQPEFANIQPAPPVHLQPQFSNHQLQFANHQAQFSNHQTQYQQNQNQQNVQLQSPENLGHLPPITKNPNDLNGAEILPEVNQNHRRPPTKFSKEIHFGPGNLGEYSDFGSSQNGGFEEGGGFPNHYGGFAGFDMSKYGNFGSFENSFEDFPGSALTTFKYGPNKIKAPKLSNFGSGGSPKRSHRFSRGSIMGSRRPARFVLASTN